MLTGSQHLSKSLAGRPSSYGFRFSPRKTVTTYFSWVRVWLSHLAALFTITESGLYTSYVSSSHALPPLLHGDPTTLFFRNHIPFPDFLFHSLLQILDSISHSGGRLAPHTFLSYPIPSLLDAGVATRPLTVLDCPLLVQLIMSSRHSTSITFSLDQIISAHHRCQQSLFFSNKGVASATVPPYLTSVCGTPACGLFCEAKGLLVHFSRSLPTSKVDLTD